MQGPPDDTGPTYLRGGCLLVCFRKCSSKYPSAGEDDLGDDTMRLFLMISPCGRCMCLAGSDVCVCDDIPFALVGKKGGECAKASLPVARRNGATAGWMDGVPCLFVGAKKMGGLCALPRPETETSSHARQAPGSDATHGQPPRLRWHPPSLPHSSRYLSDTLISSLRVTRAPCLPQSLLSLANGYARQAGRQQAATAATMPA